jgi:type II secretory pathway component PulF
MKSMQLDNMLGSEISPGLHAPEAAGGGQTGTKSLDNQRAGSRSSSPGARSGSAGTRRWRRSKIPKRDLLTTTMQLAIMVRAGVDLASALESLARQSRSVALKNVLRQIHDDVSGGTSISEALRRQTYIFGETYVASVAAGEASGRLPEVLDQLAQLQRSEFRLRGTLRTLLGYPILLASVSALVLGALVFFVLPQFAEIFEDFETPLPVITQVLLALSNELRVRFWLWGAVFAVAVVGAAVFIKSDTGRRHWDRFILRVQILRDVTQSLVIGRTFRLLGTMLDSGVPLMDSLRLVRSSIRNSLVRETFMAVEDDVLNGRGIANSLSQAAVVPVTAAEMVATAERTGSLAMVARLIGEYFEEDGESRLRTLLAILEPAIIVVMGGIIAVVVLSIMLPMFDLATLAESGS